MSAREHFCVGACMDAGHSRVAPRPSRGAGVRVRGWPRCRSRCGRTASTAARSTGSTGPRRRAGSSASRPEGARRRWHRRPAHPPGARAAGPPSRREPAAAGRTPRLGRRRAAVRAGDATASRAARSTAASAPRVAAAVKRLQAFAGLPADGVAGPATLAALRRAAPRPRPRLLLAVNAPIGDRYGPRGTGFHAGLDFPADQGTTVSAAASGRVDLRRLRRRLGPDRRPRPRQRRSRPATRT